MRTRLLAAVATAFLTVPLLSTAAAALSPQHKCDATSSADEKCDGDHKCDATSGVDHQCDD